MQGSRKERSRHLDGHRSVMERVSRTRVALSTSLSPLPYCGRINQLLRARRAAVGPLPYVIVHAFRFSAVDHSPQWNKEPPTVHRRA